MSAAVSAPVPLSRTTAAVEVRDLVKRYPKAPSDAVGGVSFEVGHGEVFGLLGPNGAGKTTTIGILTTRVRATGGHALIDGVDVSADPVRARSRLAVVPQRNNLDRSLSVRQNLLFHAAYHGVPAVSAVERADTLLAEFGLTDRRDGNVDRLSGGQAQRVMIARALMHAPRVLFLDEPSTGLDPVARLFVWERVRDLRDRGVTIVLTTHDMDEATELCDRVGIMDRGQLLALDTPGALTASLPGSATMDVTVDGDVDQTATCAALQELPGIARLDCHSAQPLQVRLYLDCDPAGLVVPVAETLQRLGGRLGNLDLGRPSLEDVFLHLTGRTLR